MNPRSGGRIRILPHADSSTGIRKDVEVPEGVEAFQNQFAVNRLVRRSAHRTQEVLSGFAWARCPDQAGREAAEVIGKAGKAIGNGVGRALNEREVGVLKPTSTDGEASRDRRVCSAANKGQEGCSSTECGICAPVAIDSTLPDKRLYKEPFPWNRRSYSAPPRMK